MSKTEYSQSNQKYQTIAVLVVCLLAALTAAPTASAQTDFTMTVSSSLSPDAVAPGGTSAASITIVTGTGFVGPITFGCTVTPSVPGTVSDPVCQVSPPTVTASGGANATLTTTNQTTTVSYTITITATDTSGTQTSQPLYLTVLSVTPQFTITVQSSVSPSSVPAGSGAEGTITVNPVNGYQSPSGGITLYCASITPLVTIAPYCSFSPTGSALTPSDNKPQSSTLTISTFGPVTTGAIVHPRTFYAFWLSLPMLALSGIGAKFGGKGSRTVWGMLGILLLSGSLLLLPACSNATTTTTTPNGITPANTYTFTIVGVDANGVASSNSGTSSGGPTVSLTVTAPKT